MLCDEFRCEAMPGSETGGQLPHLDFPVQRGLLRLDDGRRQDAVFVVAFDVDVEEVLDVADEADVDLSRLSGVAVANENVENFCALKQGVHQG